MADKFACMHCGFVFEDPDMEVCPRCGTELGQEWNPAELVDILVTDLAGSEIRELIKVVAAISGYPTNKIGPMLQHLPAVVFSGATPLQAECFLEQIRATNAAAMAENAHEKSARLKAQADALASASNAAIEQVRSKAEAEQAQRSADIEKAKLESEAKIAEAKIRAEAEAKAKAETAERIASVKAQAEADAKAKAEADAAKAQADAEKAKAEANAKIAAENAKAQAEAKAKAEADAKTAVENAKAQAEAKARAEAEKAKAEAEAVKAQAEAEKAKAEADARMAEENAKAEAEAKVKVALELEKHKLNMEAEQQEKKKILKKYKNIWIMGCIGLFCIAVSAWTFYYIEFMTASLEFQFRYLWHLRILGWGVALLPFVFWSLFSWKGRFLGLGATVIAAILPTITLFWHSEHYERQDAEWELMSKIGYDHYDIEIRKEGYKYHAIVGYKIKAQFSTGEDFEWKPVNTTAKVFCEWHKKNPAQNTFEVFKNMVQEIGASSKANAVYEFGDAIKTGNAVRLFFALSPKCQMEYLRVEGDYLWVNWKQLDDLIATANKQKFQTSGLDIDCTVINGKWYVHETIESILKKTVSSPGKTIQAKAQADAEARIKAAQEKSRQEAAIKIAAERKRLAEERARHAAEQTAYQKRVAAQQEAQKIAASKKAKQEQIEQLIMDCLNNRKAWIAHDYEARQAEEHLKKANLKYPTVKDVAMATRSADLFALQKISESGFSNWSAPEIMLAACRTPFLIIVQFIQKMGGNLHVKDDLGQTTLIVATSERLNNFEIIQYLVSQGVDINAKDNGYGGTALIYASQYSNNLKVIEYLVTQGANLNVQDGYGRTALMYASGKKDSNLETVKFLVNHGSFVNLKSKSPNPGWTALHYAACKANKKIYNFLISRRADPNIRNDRGENARDIWGKGGSFDYKD